MGFGRAFTYSFEDKNWVSKMVMTVALIFVSVIPIFGLIATATLLGYTTELVGNVHNGHPRPLPKWSDFGEKTIKGAYVLIAIIIYNLPTLLISLLLYSFSTRISQSLFGSLAFVVIVFFALSILFIYTALTGSMLAAAINRYAITGDHGSFYRFGRIFRNLQQNVTPTMQYIIFSILANLILGVLILIPCIGWVTAPSLYLTVQGYLIGDYGRQITASNMAHRRGK
jgi:hypothetical protein